MQARRVKILGLSLLALGAFLAVSASVAQAKYLVLVNKTAKSSVKFKGSLEGGRFLVPGLNLKIKCTKGAVAGSAALSEENKKLDGSVTATFTGCVVLEFEKTCFPMSKAGGVAQANGTIVAAATIKAFMGGPAGYFVRAESKAGSPFTSIEILGASCPLEEVNGEALGSVAFKIESPLEDVLTHGIELFEQSLDYSGNSATLENDAGSTALKGSVQEETGATTGLHLENLPGCEPGPC